MTASLSVVVPTYGDDDAVHDCIRATESALERVAERSEIIVVLNRMSSAGRARLQQESPGAVLIDPGENLGFAGGVTKALRLTQSEWVAVINDDCVLEPDALAELLAAGRSDESVGAVAATVRFSARPDLINSAGIEVDELGVAWERNLGYAGTDEAVTEIFGASGVLALYRRTMLDEVGGFDESFFAYLEDADLAWRARMAGWKCLYAPGARALHRHSAVLGHGSPSKHYLVGRNRVRMLAKNATTAQLCRRAAQIVIYDAAYILAVALRGRSLAPLRGRVRGLREWRTYREKGKARRNAVKLSASPGLRGALARDRAYRLVAAAGLPESKPYE